MARRPGTFRFQILLASALLLLGALTAWVAWRIPAWVADEIELSPDILTGPLGSWRVSQMAGPVARWTGGVLAGLAALAAGALAVPKRLCLWLVRLACWASYAGAVALAILVYWVTELGATAYDSAGVPLGLENLFWWRLRWLWPAPAMVIPGLLIHLHSYRRVALAAYAGRRGDEPAVGDRILENLRTGGPDPRYRKSTLASLVLHSLLIVLPLLWGLLMRGCVTPYHVPFGSGDPVVAMVMRVKPKKKPRRRYFLNPNSAIYFHAPDLEDSDVAKEVEADTQLTYAADMNAVHGRLGAGGGSQGGWPWGHKDGKVRFIRLQYDGTDWDDGLRQGRADANFLAEFRKLTDTPPKHVARKGEYHRVSLLANYPKGEAPPFVYMTGSSGISFSPRERKILREYLLDGGMLFADCGYHTWHRSFTRLMQQVFPDKRLVDIPKDDPLFKYPFGFPEGPPPLWHHGGFMCKGIKHKGRWIVFYHPGDVNDAWKTGHSGLRPGLARQAHALGVNIIWYSFTRYGELTRKYRK